MAIRDFILIPGKKWDESKSHVCSFHYAFSKETLFQRAFRRKRNLRISPPGKYLLRGKNPFSMIYFTGISEEYVKTDFCWNSKMAVNDTLKEITKTFQRQLFDKPVTLVTAISIWLECGWNLRMYIWLEFDNLSILFSTMMGGGGVLVKVGLPRGWLWEFTLFSKGHSLEEF